MKPALWFLCGGVVGALALLAQDGVIDWAERFANWRATRNLDEPVRNGIHLRQTVTVSGVNFVLVNLYVVPANRRFVLEQVGVFCNSNNALTRINVASVSGGIVARYMIQPGLESNRDALAGAVRLYGDPLTPVDVTLVFNGATTTSCEISGVGHLAQLNP